MPPIFLAEVGKKSFYLHAETIDKAGEFLSSAFKDKEIKLSESNPPSKFKIGYVSCSISKIKGSMVSFLTSKNISGKVDISILPIEAEQEV